MHSIQLRRLYEHVKGRQGVAGFYGIKDIDEFVAEVFTNPDFQNALRGINAPSGSVLKTAWDAMVRIMRSILGLSNDAHSALSHALSLGVGVVREDMLLRKKGAGSTGKASMEGVNPFGDTEQQFKDVERAYGGREAYDKAKAAGKTKLTYGQWVQVRTPNFKNWFGDWEALANREFLDGSPVSTLTGDEFKPDGVPLTEKVPQWYAANGYSTVAVEGLGDVMLDETAVKNSLSHGIGRDKATAFAAVPEVLKRGRIIHREGMRGSRDGIVVHIAAPVRYRGQGFCGGCAGEIRQQRQPHVCPRGGAERKTPAVRIQDRG